MPRTSVREASRPTKSLTISRAKFANGCWPSGEAERKGKNMITPEHARTLFAYAAWANRRMLEACVPLPPEQFTRDLGSSFRSVRDTLAHIMAAQWIWLERFHGRSPA